MITTRQLFFLNLIFMLIICLVCVFAKVRATGSDPQGTLLVSQAIARHGTIKLDAYESVLPGYSYKIQHKNDHYYYYFPLGTSVFSVPIVAAANVLGFDMIAHEPVTQAVIFLALSLAIYLLSVKVACFYLSPLRSSCVAIVFWLGTAYASTGATALWSHDFSAFFSLSAIYLLLRVKFQRDIGHPILMAFCLFAAYFCRPTLALLAPICLMAAALLNRWLALKIAVALSLFLAAFVWFSLHEFNQLLPDYYFPQRLAGDHFWLALCGNLLSPARGLLIYSPFLIAPIVWAIFSGNLLSRYKVEIILAIWPVLHLITISRFPHWWAGYSFGSRLMMDVLPGLFVLLVCYLAQSSKQFSLHWVLFIGLSFVAVWINGYQGLFNRSAAEWNARPSIDEFPEYLFDWKYPQFLSTPERLEQRMMQHEINIRKREAESSVNIKQAMEIDLKAINARKVKEVDTYTAQLMRNPIVISAGYDFRSPNLYFLGWSPSETLFRWSEGYHVEILFYLEPDLRTASSIVITAFALHPQRFRLLLNGNVLGNFDIGAAEQELSIKVEPQDFHSGTINTLHFELPAAKQPINGDPHILALAFRKIRLSE